MPAIAEGVKFQIEGNYVGLSVGVPWKRFVAADFSIFFGSRIGTIIITDSVDDELLRYKLDTLRVVFVV